MSQSNPIVAIVGRPNVGKSTLFNRIAQKRKSIIHSEAGITRDRVYETVNWTGRQFVLVDTGGFIPESDDRIESAIRLQVHMAIEEAELVLFVVDAVDSVTAMDREIATMLRTAGKPVVLVVNKNDNEKREREVYEFYELGHGDPFPISALNGRRIGDLLDRVLEALPREAPQETDAEDHLQLAIVGMPNAGKSSVLNAILGMEKAIVTEIPGTTRDSIDSEIQYYGQPVTLIDTAGLRKKRYISTAVEFYSMVRAQLALERCQVALCVIDASKGFTRQDASIIRAVLDRKKGLVLLLNKWDLVEKSDMTYREFEQEIAYQFRAMEYYPKLFISAKTRQRVSKILDTAMGVYAARRERITTHKLNQYFQKVIDRTPPPAMKGKHIKIKYVTQVKKEPPVFAFYCSDPKLIKEEYRRFLENQLRQGFGFFGVPLTISFRQK